MLEGVGTAETSLVTGKAGGTGAWWEESEDTGSWKAESARLYKMHRVRIGA